MNEECEVYLLVGTGRQKEHYKHYSYKNCLSSYWPSSVFTLEMPVKSLAFIPECSLGLGHSL